MESDVMLLMVADAFFQKKSSIKVVKLIFFFWYHQQFPYLNKDKALKIHNKYNVRDYNILKVLIFILCQYVL